MQKFSLCFSKVKKDCLKFIKSQETKADKFKNKEKMIRSFLIPLCFWISKKSDKKRPYFVGLAGGQGTGKTTISSLIKIILTKFFKLKVFRISIDDFYKTRKERISLSKRVHPMLLTRGVPGTHDVGLGLETLESLCQAEEDTLTAIPSFSKPLDQHFPRESWQRYKGRPDFIFFDAWCGGARPLPTENWKGPMNALEEEEDPDGIWSRWSNSELSRDYQLLFERFDLLLLIKVPSMEHVYESRWLQEQTLEKTLSDPEMLKKIMTKEQVYRFVMYYERLTRYVLEEMPSFADIVLDRSEGFEFAFSKHP